MDEILERILDCMGGRHGAGKELAEHLGISPNVITNWKNESNKSYRKYLKQIAEFYNVSHEYLLGNEKKPSIDEDEELAEYIEALKFNPGMRLLFSKTKHATKADIDKVIKMIDIMKGTLDE